MSEPLTDDALIELARRYGTCPEHARVGRRCGDPRVLALVAEARRLRAENADLRAAARAGAAGVIAADAENQRAQLAGAGLLDEFAAHIGGDLAEWMCEALLVARVRADRYAAALAHIEALGLHAPECVEYGRAGVGYLWTCVPECPTATAKKAREGT